MPENEEAASATKAQQDGSKLSDTQAEAATTGADMKGPHQLREQVSLITNLLDELEIERTLDIQRKHPRLLYEVAGKGFIQIIPDSSFDMRAVLNMRGNVLRTIRKTLGK
jgi:hypothetical protein